MNWLTALFSGNDALKVVGDTVDHLFTNDDAREKALESQKAQQAFDLAIAQLDAQALQNQTDIDKTEAVSASLFVSGWRPFVGWICAFALTYSAIIEPIARFVARVGFDYSGDFPTIDTTITLQVLLGMLGLSSMRSYEKLNGVARK